MIKRKVKVTMIEERISTKQREQLIDVTAVVQGAVGKSEVKNGICVVSVPHTTAGITVQENADPDVVSDVLMALEHIVPADLPYKHGEGNSTAHIKTILTGSSVNLPIRAGRLVLGTWQCIYFCEYDGPRTRKLFIETAPVVE